MAALVVNTGARHGGQAEAAKQALEAAGVDVEEMHQVDSAEIPGLLRDLGTQHRLVVVGGGDGTISLAAQELAHRQTVLGILPMGTQNSFARSLGLPLGLEEAAGAVAKGRTRAVDLGEIAGQVFTHSVTLGVSTLVAQQTGAALKRVAGQAAYMMVGSKVLTTHAPFRCRFLVDGAPRIHDTHQVVITSGGGLGPAELSPDARPDDRRLHVATVGADSRWQFVRGWVASVTGEEVPEGSERFEARDLVVSTQPPQRVDVDGEPGPLTPVRLRVLPGALRIRMP